MALANQNVLDVKLVQSQLDSENFMLLGRGARSSGAVLKIGEPPERSEAVIKDDFSRKIIELLHLYRGNRTKVAEKMGISRTTLWQVSFVPAGFINFKAK